MEVFHSLKVKKGREGDKVRKRKGGGKEGKKRERE